MFSSLPLLLITAAAVSAARDDNTRIVSLLLPYNDRNKFTGTVLAADTTATTYVFSCASAVARDDCGMDGPGTVVQGPSTWQYQQSHSEKDAGSYSMNVACALTSSRDMADCTVSGVQSDDESGVASSVSHGTMDYLSNLQPVTILGGLDKLSPGAVPTVVAAMATATDPAAVPSATPSGVEEENEDEDEDDEDGRDGSKGDSTATNASGSPSLSVSSSSGQAKSTTTVTGNAAPAVTQQAILAGVVAAVGVLAM